MMPVRLAMIGCGAVAEIAHLPAGRSLAHGGFTVLVDIDERRRTRLAAEFGVATTVADWTAAADAFDAAVVALPHHLHEPVCTALARAGKHLLVEKPLACTHAAATAITEAADQAGIVLGVGLQRRFGWGPLWLKELIENGALGRIESFDVAEGGVYDWPVASDFFFRRETAGGGVLIDTGAHTLDLVLWWLGDYATVRYADDRAGGIEAECELALTLRSGAQGRVALSRLRRMRNTAIIRGSGLTAELSLHTNQLTLRSTAAGHQLAGEVRRAPNSPSQYYHHLIAAQLQQFVDAIRSGGPAHVTGRSALPSIRLIEECYRHPQPLLHPWTAVPVAGSAP
jgi:predicted dehydrogenase